MSAIHPTAQAGWGGRGAADYEAGRPGYPPAAVALIAAELGIGFGDEVLDLAAGTGKFTRELLGLGPEVRVVAVEPVAEMRAQLSATVPGVRVLDGTAESIPVPDGSVRAVTVAQAFHWFDVPRAAAEIARVLTDDGGLAIVRNEWAREGWGEALNRYVDAASGDRALHERDWAAELDATGRFAALERAELANPQRGTLDGLLRRVASMSSISALPDPERERVLDGARRLLRDAGLPEDGPVDVPTRTIVRWARRR